MADSAPAVYQPFVDFVYTCVDRIYVRGYVPLLQRCGGFRTWAERLRPDQPVTQGWIRSLARRFHENVRTFAQERGIPVVEARSKQRKQEIAREYRVGWAGSEGVYLIIKSRGKAKTYASSEPKRPGRHKPNHRDLRRREAFVTYYSFYLLDRLWGEVCVMICSHAPFGVRVFLNGHSWVQRRARQRGLEVEVDDNAFVTSRDPHALQALCDELTERDIQRVADRWVYRLLPILSYQQRRMSRFRYEWSNAQMELSHNRVFASGFPLDELFHRHIDWNRRLLGPKTVASVFGKKKARAAKSEVALLSTHTSLTVLRIKHHNAVLKQYDKHGHILRTECVSNDPRRFGVGRRLANFPGLKAAMAASLERFLALEQAVTASTLNRGELTALAQTSELGKSRVPGIRLDNERLMTVLRLLGHLATQPRGFRAGELRHALEKATGQSYSPGQACYDLRKLRAKGILVATEKTRYVFSDTGAQQAALLFKLHQMLLAPSLAAAARTPLTNQSHRPRPGPRPQLAPAQLRHLLTRHRGNVARAARDLGKQPCTVRRWVRREGIALDRLRHPVPAPDRESAYRALDRALARVAAACDLQLAI